jgi:uncharacterized protein YlzI (FlbEa/FlbD family)
MILMQALFALGVIGGLAEEFQSISRFSLSFSGITPHSMMQMAQTNSAIVSKEVQGVEEVIDRIIENCRRAVSLFHPGGIYDFGDYLDYREIIRKSLIGDSKYYHLSAEMNHSAIEHSFEI